MTFDPKAKYAYSWRLPDHEGPRVYSVHPMVLSLGITVAKTAHAIFRGYRSVNLQRKKVANDKYLPEHALALAVFSELVPRGS